MKLNIDTLFRTCQDLRCEAETARAFGGAPMAATMEACVDAFESGIEEWLNECLTPTQAGEEGPKSAASFAKDIRDGRVPQAGQRGRPLVRRRHMLGIADTGLVDDVIDGIVDGRDGGQDSDDPFPSNV